MPNSTAYLCACGAPCTAQSRPLHGAQGHAVQHAQQHGVPLLVLLSHAAHPAPRKAAPPRGAGACSAACPTARRTCTRAPFSCGAPCAALSRPSMGRRGMQCSMPISTAYLYACSFSMRRTLRCAKPPLNGSQGHAEICPTARRTFTRAPSCGAPRASQSRPYMGRHLLHRPERAAPLRLGPERAAPFSAPP